ncbi:terminase small subunit [Paenimyroides tangerinum]|uniref:Terminase small subunit n=1 Tax=Paenimyroides tangerinum TaxID=2488728 RepID=A0A3P3WB26_9FLAO|nr:terminase small subunit [Paenimyroides tangerinum]RRJ91517.1 terminase small subunit [Paenimyroides tangerinum]
MSKPLTIKQEIFCQAYLRLGDKSAAYREAYSCSNMKAETIHSKASLLSSEDKVRARIEQLQKEAIERNKATLDEVLIVLADIIRFDPAAMYDENGTLLPIHKMPKKVRMCIQSFEVQEIPSFNDEQPETLTKKVKHYDKLAGVEKLMKHLGGYELDNKQKATNIFQPDDRQIRLDKLTSKLKK